MLTALCVADNAAAGHGGTSTNDILSFGRHLDGALEKMPVHTSDLCYSGSRLNEALGSPRLVGPFLKIALQRIQDGNLANNEEDITTAAHKWAVRQQANGT